MKVILTTLATALLIAVFVPNLNAQDQTNDIEAVRTTVNYYLEGGTNYDTETLLKAFHKEARMRWVKDGEFTDVNAYDFFNRPSQPDKAPADRKTYVETITVSGDVASAILRIDYPTFSYRDHMQLLKIDGNWKIVSKIFYRQMHEEAIKE